jgi:hypothetical protein
MIRKNYFTENQNVYLYSIEGSGTNINGCGAPCDGSSGGGYGGGSGGGSGGGTPLPAPPTSPAILGPAAVVVASLVTSIGNIIDDD